MNKVTSETSEPKPESLCKKRLRETFFLFYIALTWTYVGLIAYFLASAIIILYDLKNSSSYSLSSDILYVWKNKKSITDITLTSSNRCASGYSFAYDLNWPGISALCNCPEESSINDNIHYFSNEGNCTQSQLNNSCINSNQISSKNLNRWRNGKKICVKYGSDSFFSMPINCDQSSEYKKCGQGETQICVKNSEPCPVTSIIITTSRFTNSQYNLISLDSSYYLYYAYDQQNLPTAYFKVSNSYFCAFHDKDFLPNQASFIYTKNSENYNCDIVDEDFQIIDEIGQLDFFTLNNLISDLMSIPSYPKPSNEYTTFLGSRTYQYWSYTCRSSADYNLNNYDDKFSLSADTSYQIGLIIVTVASLFISGILLPIIDLTKRYLMGPERRADAKVLKMGTLILDKFFRFALLPIVLVCYLHGKEELNWLKAIEDYKCSTQFFINNVKKPYFTSLNDIVGFYGNIIAVWVLMVILDIIYLTIRFYTDQKKQIVKPKIRIAEENKPLNKVKIAPEISEKETPPKDDHTDLEDNLIEEGEIKRLEKEVLKTIGEANAPSKAQIKALEVELKGTMNEAEQDTLTKNNINSHDFLIPENEEKKLEEQIPRNQKNLPPIKVKKLPSLGNNQISSLNKLESMNSKKLI